MPYDTLLFVFFVILLLIDIRKTISNTSFSKENTDLYKGICTLMVFCHHLSQRVDGSIFLFCGYLAVAGFFLVSGHGLMCSFKSNGLYYIRVIIMKKVPQLLLMCAVAVSISIVYFSILGERVSFLEVGGGN